ncbi:helix-turn-helix transcriptional regulator, partial [Bacillus atrophaeus]
LPVHTWLQQRRMERAAELLRDSSLSVLGVAQSVGYSSASQFSAAFRRQYGMSPTMYRKMSEPA